LLQSKEEKKNVKLAKLREERRANKNMHILFTHASKSRESRNKVQRFAVTEALLICF